MIFIQGFQAETPGPLLGRVVVRTGGDVGQPYAAPVISPTSATDSNPITVTISAEPGAVIYFTTDGSTPNEKSPRFFAPFTLHPPARILAVAYGTRPPSPITEQIYGGNSSELRMLKPLLTAGGKLRLESIGLPPPLVIQYSSDLKNWFPLATNSGSTVVEDVLPADRSYRYYRAVQQ